MSESTDVQGFANDGSPVTLSRQAVYAIMAECHPWRPQSETDWLIQELNYGEGIPFCTVCGDFHPVNEECSNNSRQTYRL